jgi:ATP-dependent Clp protease ATP-binding subunit ClpX
MFVQPLTWAHAEYTQDLKTTCSFCKEQPPVSRLITGPGEVNICSACVSLCNEIIAERKEKEREEMTAEIVELLSGLPDSWQNDHAASALYDAGYRKMNTGACDEKTNN